jgi:Putative F0F1-ATPase subunit Ca2+/Mg2+ transporter
MLSPNKEPDKKNSNRQVLYQYAGMATQFLVVIGIMVYAGLKADQWLNWKLPIWVWVLPLVAIVGMIYTIIRRISNK